MVMMLQPGDRAETHGMSVSKLNGRKGTIVCYMEDTDRYLLELDDETTMSLRKRNLKSAEDHGDAPNPMPNNPPHPVVEDVFEDNTMKNQSTPSSSTSTTSFRVHDIVRYRRVDGTTSRAVVTEMGPVVENQPTLVVRILATNVEKTVPTSSLELLVRGEATTATKQQTTHHPGDHPYVVQPNLVLESLFASVYEAVASASWMALLVGFVAVRWLWMTGSGDDRTTTTTTTQRNRYNHDGYEYYYSYSPRYWHWYGIVGGLGSFLLVVFLAHKLGTNNGKRAFSWDRAWQGLYNLDIWTLIRLAGVLEIALHFIGNLTGGGGGGYRRRR